MIPVVLLFLRLLTLKYAIILLPGVVRGGYLEKKYFRLKIRSMIFHKSLVKTDTPHRKRVICFITLSRKFSIVRFSNFVS